MTKNILPAIEIEPAVPATASVIWLHGLGADGHDFETVVPALSLPQHLGLRFVFPHAPYRSVTINNGYVMRAWYDIFDSSFLEQEDAAGIKASSAELEKLIEHEIDRGIVPERIILAGFSQGGAISLYTGLHYPRRLAGIMALSTYLPLMNESEPGSTAKSRDMPIMMAHGTEDLVVPWALATNSKALLEKAGFRIEWHSYAMGHSLCPEEIGDISSWLVRVLEN
jgi:phospholipase/carboxylesterase